VLEKCTGSNVHLQGAWYSTDGQTLEAHLPSLWWSASSPGMTGPRRTLGPGAYHDTTRVQSIHMPETLGGANSTISELVVAVSNPAAALRFGPLLRRPGLAAQIQFRGPLLDRPASAPCSSFLA